MKRKKIRQERNTNEEERIRLERQRAKVKSLLQSLYKIRGTVNKQILELESQYYEL